jgi:hypothetical protein
MSFDGHPEKKGLKMSQLVLRVRDVLAVPGRNAVVASVEVLGGQPTVGCLLGHPDEAGDWRIVGFGDVPAASHNPALSDLLLKPVSGEQHLREGIVLAERAEKNAHAPEQ